MKHNYINNKQFFEAILERKRLLRDAKKHRLSKPPLTEYLGQCLLLIAQNLAHLPRFAKYPHREEMEMDGVENAIRYFDNYKTKYKNPHAYFTKIIYWAFVRRIKKENAELYAKYKLHEQIGVLTALDGLTDGEVSGQFQVYANISEFIDNYETKERKRKAEQLQKQLAAAKTTRKRASRKPIKRIKRKSKIRKSKIGRRRVLKIK